MDKIFEIGLKYNQEKLLDELKQTKLYDNETYNDPHNPVWLKGTVLQEAPEVDRIKSLLPHVNIAAFFIQPAGTVINPHRDKLCKCSLNILINHADAPIIIEGEEFYYTCALINVNKYEHEVPASQFDRYLLRYTFSEPFEIMRPLLSNLS